jgi:hypothetical protein
MYKKGEQVPVNSGPIVIKSDDIPLAEEREIQILTIPDQQPAIVQAILNTSGVYWMGWTGWMQTGTKPDDTPVNAVNICLFATKQKAVDIGGAVINALRLPKGVILSSMKGYQSIVQMVTPVQDVGEVLPHCDPAPNNSTPEESTKKDEF